MNGNDTTTQRLEMMKQHEMTILQQIRDAEENLKKIQLKIARLEREVVKNGH
jgi:hypothetical protein